LSDPLGWPHAPRSRPVLAVLTAALALSACGGEAGTAASASDEGRLAVAAGFYPYEFVASRVGGPDVEVTNLTKPGGEPHDLELTPQQVAGLTETDLVVYSPGFQPAVDEAVEQQASDRAFDVLSAVELREATEGGTPTRARTPRGGRARRGRARRTRSTPRRRRAAPTRTSGSTRSGSPPSAPPSPTGWPRSTRTAPRATAPGPRS
jgi:hypothetical protein